MPMRYHADRAGDAIVLEEQGRASARIAPLAGNNVTHFATSIHGGPFDVLLSPDPAVPFRGGHAAGLPILFPFPNRVRDARYEFAGRTYSLDPTDRGGVHHIHGLVRDRPWTVEDIGASNDAGAWMTASIKLEAFPDLVRQFPFPCTLTITTALRDGALHQRTIVENTGSTALPMGYGIHPWFPSRVGDAARGETEVHAPAHKRWILEGNMPTGAKEPATGVYDLTGWRALDGQLYDDVFTDLIRRADGWSVAAVRYPSIGVEIRVEASPEFREWVVFAPLHRDAVCLEPYTSVTDAVNLARRGIDAGLVVVPPGGRWSGEVRIAAGPSG
jgi:aldose 1-epimerase